MDAHLVARPERSERHVRDPLVRSARPDLVNGLGGGGSGGEHEHGGEEASRHRVDNGLSEALEEGAAVRGAQDQARAVAQDEDAVAVRPRLD